MALTTAREDLNTVTPQKNFATPELLDKVREVESSNIHIDPTTKRLTRSPTGAEGAYQILPSTQKRPGYGVAPVRNRTEAEHRRFAGDYLNALSRKYGDDAKAVVAYNQGPGTVDRAVREAEAAGTTWYAALEKKEGRDYLVKVLGAGAIPTLAVAQAPAPDMSRPVTVNPNMRAQVERIRGQRASAQAAPGAVPVDRMSTLTPVQQFGVDKVGAGFQAALGFSMLGASGRGLPTAEEGEAGGETAELTAEPSAKQALSSLRGLPTFDAFAAQRQAQPVQMADGGSLNDLGDDVGVVGYSSVGESTNDTPVAPQIKLRRSSASKSMGSMPQESKEKQKASKGTARQQLTDLQYKTELTSAAIKDKLRGLGEDTFGAPTLTSSRGKLTRGPLSVASFDKGGDAKKEPVKDPVSEAAGMLETFKKYGEKARNFMVENGISPTDIASGFIGLKKGTALGLLTYSGGLNEGEDAEVAKMREAARQQPQRFAWGGTAAARGEYYNPKTKAYANTLPMIDNPDYTTKTYYERDPSGNYAVSKDPFKAAGSVYSYTPAVAGAPVYDDGYSYNPGTPDTPESYDMVAKPAATWNQAKITDLNSGYTRTSQMSPNDFRKTKDYQDYVKSQEGGMQTQDMYDSPYFGSQTSGSYGRGLDQAYKDWAGDNVSVRLPEEISLPTPVKETSSVLVPIPVKETSPVLVPTNFSDIAAPVVRNNPYAMPGAPVARAEGSPPEGEKPLKDRVAGWMRDTEKTVSKPLGLMEIRSYATNRPKELGLKGEIGGEADAMRHLLLARELRTKFPNTAAGMLWAHEAIPSNPILPWQSDKERAQDTYNNDLAKRLMGENPQATREEYEKRALEAIRSGEAQSGLTKKDPKHRAGGSPEEGERSVGDRLKGYGETAASLLSGLGASIPAGYSGLVELARTRDPEKAAEEISRRQAAMTYEPRTASGKKSLESAAELLENLNIPAQYVGDKAFEASGESPLAGAAAQTLLDPLNYFPAAKGLAKAGKKGVLKAIENASMPGDSYFAGPLGKQRGAVKPYKGTFARNSPEFLASKEHPDPLRLPDDDYVSNLEKYYAEARKQVKDAGGDFQETTPAQKQAMQEFYDNKAMPYFEELHGTLRDPVFESLMEGRITPSGSSADASGFRPYMIKAAKRKTAESKIRYPADPDAYLDITRRYDNATGLTPTLYYPSEANLIESAVKQNPLIAPREGGGVTSMDTGKFSPNKMWNKEKATGVERSRIAKFINEQLTKQQEALSPQMQNQYLNPPGDYGVTVKEPGNLSSYSDKGTKVALSDLERKLSGEPAPYQTTPMRSADVESARALLDELKQKRASMTNQNEIDFVNQQIGDLLDQVMSGGKKTSAYNVSDKMLEAMSRNEAVWDIGSGTQEIYGRLNFLSPEHLNDYMRTLSPEKIRETPFAQMVEESSKHQVYKSGVDQLVKDIEAGKSVNPKVFSNGVSEPVKTYDDGFRWVKANDENALKLNGTSIGHCLKRGAKNCSLSGEAGGTGRKSFDSGDTEIYFLQDARGVPVTTVEVINAKDPTKRTISQTKGNGTKTGDKAPVDYDSMVYDLAKQLNPVKISESHHYLSPLMRGLNSSLVKSNRERPFKRGGAVSAARLLKEMPRTHYVN